VSKEDKENFYWFLSSVVSVISGGKAVSTTNQSKKKGAAASYRDLVTTSDEAFAFMVIKHHADKWNPPENGTDPLKDL